MVEALTSLRTSERDSAFPRPRLSAVRLEGVPLAEAEEDSFALKRFAQDFGATGTGAERGSLAGSDTGPAVGMAA